MSEPGALRDPLDTYYCYNDPVTGRVEVLTGREIVASFYSVWQERLRKAGKDPSNYCAIDCIDDWVVENWAWESDDGD